MRPAFQTIIFLPLLALTLATSGCSPLRERVSVGEVTLPSAYSESALTAAGKTSISSEWWRGFGDERLNSIMDKVFNGNLDLKTAFERLKEATAAAGTARSSLFPSITLKGYGGRVKQNSLIDLDPQQTYRASFAANYELDIWRKLSKRARAGRLNALATREEVKTLHIAISAEVVNEYFFLLERQAQLKLALDSEAGYEDTLERVELHYREGLTSSEGLYLARRSLSAVKARRPLIEADIKLVVNALALLTGNHSIDILNATDYDRISKANLPSPPLFKAGLPATLLTDRPDIKAAYLRLEAKDSLLAVAVAERFPSFNLSAEYGGASKNLKNILDSPNILWNILLSAAMPVIDGKRRAMEAKRAEARLKESLFEYQKSVLSAFHDVENSLSAMSAMSERVLQLEEHTKITTEALWRAETDYRAGLTNYLPVIEAQNILNSSQSDLISARYSLITAATGVARALGGGGGEGGWSDAGGFSGMETEDHSTADIK